MRPRVVLVHGSATDHTTWSIQLGSSLKSSFELVAPDRDFSHTTVEQHAADLAGVVGTRAIVVGSSFGDALMAYDTSTLMGLCDAEGKVYLNPPMETQIQ